MKISGLRMDFNKDGAEIYAWVNCYTKEDCEAMIEWLHWAKHTLAKWEKINARANRTGPEEYLQVEHSIEELKELHDLVERGPDWGTISEIRITHIPLPGREKLTIQQAANE